MNWPHRLGFWTLICGVSAAPSLLWGWGLHPKPEQVFAMLLGILIFIVGYTLVTGIPFVQRLKRRQHVRTTLKVGYGTRLGMSIIFPVGLYIDMIPGILATALVENLMDIESFGGVLLTTLVQGALLNVLLSLYMLLVYGLVRLFSRKPDVAAPLCLGCGYDMRGSGSRCPECGRVDESVERVTQSVAA